MNKKILLVDDERDTLRVFTLLLEKCGYVVSTATNGREALESVAASKPDLILLDVMMPEMSGSEALARLKSSAETRDIPVVILSAKDEPEDLQQGWEGGTDLYLIKPIVGSELVEYLDCILQ